MKRQDYFDKFGKIDESKLPQIKRTDLIMLFLGVPFSYLLPLVTLITIVILCMRVASFLGPLHVASPILDLLGLLALLLAYAIPVICVVGVIAALNVFTESFSASIWKRKGHEIGKMLEPSEHSTFIDDIKEVCRGMDVSMPDNIVISFEATCYVTQGKVLLREKILTGRTLVIGLLFLKYLTRSEIKSILAHEMAHFTGKDTLFGNFVNSLYTNLKGILNGLDKLGNDEERVGEYFATLPITLILTTYLNLYARIEKRFSRDREKRADYITAIFYGSDTFKHALIKIANIQGPFNTRFERDFYNAYQDNILFKNYFLFFDECIKDAKYDLLSEEDLGNETNAFDEHYSTVERLNYLPDIQVEIQDTSYENYDPAWEEEITEDMVRYFLSVMSRIEEKDRQENSKVEN